MKYTVRNLSDYAKDRKYIVVTECNGDLWFYSATDRLGLATDMVKEWPEARSILENSEVNFEIGG